MSYYASSKALIRECGGILQPPERLTVSEAAERYRRLNNKGAYVGAWKNDMVPYLPEIMDTLTSREYEAVCFVTSAQSAKTEAILNWIGYTARCDGADMLIYEKSMDDAQDFSKRRVDRLHTNSAELGACLNQGKSADTVLTKFYKNGSMVSLLWPTKNKLAGKPAARVALTDYDRMPQNVDGEGSPFELARKRTTTFRSFAMTYVESSPSFPILDPKWRPKTTHEAPPCKGIFGIYNSGDRRCWYWPCPECGFWYQPSFSLLEYDPTDDFVAAGESVRMPCPNTKCGAAITPSSRASVNRNGRWLKDGQTFDDDGNIVGDARRSDIASFWLKGVAAAFNSWPKMVTRYLQALEHMERTGDEEKLKTTVNTDQGEAHLPRHQQLIRVPEDLMNRAGDYGERVVPLNVRFLIATIDVQGNRFEVSVHGVGLAPDAQEFDLWLIDRFKISKSNRIDSDGDHYPVKPHSYLEDWLQIEDKVISKTYPLADDSGRVMQIKVTGCDSGGRQGVTSMAYAYWRRLKKKGLGHRFRLLKGEPKRAAPRVREAYPDSQRKDRHAGARGEIPVLLLNTNLLKDWLDKILDREVPGGGYLHFPDWMIERKRFLFDELCSEARNEKGEWKQTSARNEQVDLAYYCLALIVFLKCERLNWQNAPIWARPWDENPLVIDPKDKQPAEKSSGKSLSDLGADLL